MCHFGFFQLFSCGTPQTLRAVPGAMDRASISALTAAQIMHLIVDLLIELIHKLHIPIDSDGVIEIRIPRTVLARVPDPAPLDSV